MTIREYYGILELATDADLDDLKKAFREKAKLFHPDLNPSSHAHDNFILIHTAYEMVLAHLIGKSQHHPVLTTQQEKEKRQQEAAMRAQHYARMKYEEFIKECEAYKKFPYNWIFQILYYGLFYLYMFCAMIFIFVPLWAGWEGGIFYFLICTPLFVLAYFTIIMAYNWKKEIDPLFS